MGELVSWANLKSIRSALGVMVTSQKSLAPPKFAVATMEACPALWAVTLPFSTVATLSLVLFQVTVLTGALLGLTVALSVNVPSSGMVWEVALSVTPSTGMDLSSKTVTLQ